jgi:hypothetical protein
LPQALGRLGQEGFAHRRRQPAQLLVGRLSADGQLPVLAAALETLAGTAVVLEQGVAG